MCFHSKEGTGTRGQSRRFGRFVVTSCKESNLPSPSEPPQGLTPCEESEQSELPQGLTVCEESLQSKQSITDSIIADEIARNVNELTKDFKQKLHNTTERALEAEKKIYNLRERAINAETKVYNVTERAIKAEEEARKAKEEINILKKRMAKGIQFLEEEGCIMPCIIREAFKNN